MKFTNNYDYQTNMKALHKLNTQISSGLKIQNSFEDSSVYNDGMRLDYEVATLEQVQTATSKAQHFSKNTDKALGEFKILKQSWFKAPMKSTRKLREKPSQMTFKVSKITW